MKPDLHRLLDYLDHIVQAITRIKSYTADLDEEGFLHTEVIQDAVIRNLEVIGEASHNIEIRFPEFAAAHPDIPLAFAYQMRNAVAHGYFKVDLVVVWNTLENDLPNLEGQITEAAATLDASMDT